MSRKTVDFPTPQTPEQTNVPEDIAILVDRYIGDGDKVNIKVVADLRYLQQDQEDYKIKLLDARGIPQDFNNIPPDDPVIHRVLSLPSVKAMPEKTQEDRHNKNRAVLTEVIMYYTKEARQVDADAIMLALTMENEFTEAPQPYEKQTTGRVRPGLNDFPPTPRNLANPIEYRLKQLLDILSQSPEAMAQLSETTQYLSADIARRLQMVDRDGFRNRRTD